MTAGTEREDRVGPCARFGRRLGGLGLGLLLVGALAACSAPAAEPQTTVLVVGDSASARAEGRTWTDMVAVESSARVETDIVPDSGWLSASPYSVRDRVLDADADVVVLALGEDDLGSGVPEGVRRTAIQDGIGAAVETGARVLVLTPLAPDQAGNVEWLAWNDDLSQAARDAGAEFVDVPFPGTGRFVDGDGALDEAGQRWVAEQVTAALARP